MRMIAFFSAGVVACSFGLVALGADADDGLALQPAYIETNNGFFSVCAFDRRDGVLLRYKGIHISRTNLPPASITRPVLIYALGNQPWKGPQAAASWQPQPEVLNDGKIPYPVKDVDPPFELCRTAKSEILIGVRIRSWFYAITNAGDAVKTELPGVAMHESDGNRLCVVTATLPKHREKELSTLIESLQKE